MYRWHKDCGSSAANSSRLCVQWLIISETLPFPQLIWEDFSSCLQSFDRTAIFKELHLTVVVSAISPFFLFVLLPCVHSSCDYVLWLQDGLLQSL